MSDLTNDDCLELRRLHDVNAQLLQRIAPEVLEIKTNQKKIDALVDRAAKAMTKAKRNTRNRYGITFRFVESAGRVSWRKIVEKLKSKEYADGLAADPPRTRKLIYEFPRKPIDEMRS